MHIVLGVNDLLKLFSHTSQLLREHNVVDTHLRTNGLDGCLYHASLLAQRVQFRAKTLADRVNSKQWLRDRDGLLSFLCLGMSHVWSRGRNSNRHTLLNRCDTGCLALGLPPFRRCVRRRELLCLQFLFRFGF